jgi:flagellar basal-body rod modification protein FlgD
METTSVATSRAASQTAGAAPSADKAGQASDYETFLRMLTTQLKHQDPLNPMESTDFAVQLATFSQVEQTQKSNELLATITGQLGMTGMAELANWVGMEARSPSPVLYEGTPITLVPDPAALADQAVLLVKNAEGRVLARQDHPASDAPFTWPPEGSDLPAGRYSFELESLRGGQVVATTPVETYGRIVEARGSVGGTMLVLAGDIEVASASVTAVRRP